MIVPGMHLLFGSWIIVIALLLGTTAESANAQSIKVYTWPDYMDPEIVSEFEQKHDTVVDFGYFDSDEARDQELAITNGGGFDVLLVNRLQIPKYVRRGWLNPVTLDDVPNKRHIDKRWSDTLGDASDYAVANFWGTMGIGYREDLFPEGISSWAELLKPDETLRNRLNMPAFTRELVAMAMKSEGLSVNNSDETMIVEAGRKLLEQKPFVRHYGYPLLDESSELVTGKAWAGAYYNGDVLTLQGYDEHIRFVVPEEGTVIWADYLTVAQSSTNKPMAFAFINFLNDPRIAARQAQFTNLATPNTEARRYLPEEYLSHSTIYPSTQVLEQSEFLEALPPRSQKQINVIGTQLSQ